MLKILVQFFRETHAPTWSAWLPEYDVMTCGDTFTEVRTMAYDLAIIQIETGRPRSEEPFKWKPGIEHYYGSLVLSIRPATDPPLTILELESELRREIADKSEPDPSTGDEPDCEDRAWLRGLDYGINRFMETLAALPGPDV